MDLDIVGKTWGGTLPENLHPLSAGGPPKAGRVAGSTFSMPWPALTLPEIAAARATREDWELAVGYVPVMGDFHNLVCLDYRKSASPEVVVIDDDRNEIARFNSIDELIGALTDAD